MSKKLIKFICGEENLLVKKIDVSTSLKEVRNLLAEKLEMEYSFLMDGSNVDKDDENDITVEDICTQDNKILIKKAEKSIIVNKPIPKSKKVGKIGELDIYLYPSEKFTFEEELGAITLMVVGQTGSGKTTLLNSLINFVMGIQLNDTFRYYLINEETGRNQSESQTSDVTIYYIKAYNGFPPLKIVDTPGFGDTRGIQEDKKITEKIEKKFREELDYINGICFVAQSSNARLTINQKYIFSKIMELFGNDVAENFIAMITFCDGQTPPLVNALQQPDALFDKLIPSIGNPWYFKFNNSAIFTGNRDEFTQMFWKLGMENFNTFFKKLVTIPRKSLVKSKEVLKERQTIETTIQNLRPKLDRGLEMMEKIRKQVVIVEQNIDKINGNADFVTYIPEVRFKTVQNPPHNWTTTCLECKYTCLAHCGGHDDDHKKDCCVIDSHGYCTECPKKCHWSMHKNTTYIYEKYTVDVPVTNEELKRKYNVATNDKNAAEKIIEGLKKDFEKLQLECLETQDKIRISVNRLKEIALNNNTFESSEEYINLMILSEKEEKKAGYLDRVKALENLKAVHKQIRDLYKGNSQDIIQFEQFKKDLLEKKKKEPDKCNIF